MTRLELPGWGQVLDRFARVSYRHDHLWADAPVKTIRGKEHRYLMELDLTNWSARMTYFLGRYYELHILRLLDEHLGPGDRFVDIGANIGMISLHASHLVGAGGKVDSFEPNPQCVNQLQRMIDLNGIKNIEIHPIGLADEESELELRQNHSHTGIGTFAKLDPDEVVVSTLVPVRRADQVFDPDDPAPKLIKIDVEGFELNVVRGMEQTLRRWGAPIVMEMNEGHLSRAGTSSGSCVRSLSGLATRPTGSGLSAIACAIGSSSSRLATTKSWPDAAMCSGCEQISLEFLVGGMVHSSAR